MAHTMHRRQFLQVSALAVAAATSGVAAAQAKTVRVGIIGTGGRGKGLLGTMLPMKGVAVPAVCDINSEAAAAASKMVVDAGQAKPHAYTAGDHDYRNLLARDDLDAVIIATPWNWHTPMAVDSMKRGKYTAVEVPAATSVRECWDLVRTHEDTGVPCMMLENWSFRQDNLAVLQMMRQGLFGEIVHCHCAHSHDCVDHWFFDTNGNMRWGGEFLVNHNRDQYPTHSVGPVLSWLDINCGDAFDTIASTASDSKGINAHFARKFGPDHPNAKREYKQGDIVTSVVRTKKGKTLVINYDMQLPRPYDNRWMLQGTLGVYSEDRASIYLEGKSPQYHEWEPFAPYQEQYNHPWWKAMQAETSGDVGHGGTDYLELKLFLQAVREGTQTPIDVYDSATMSSIVGLSEISIRKRGKRVKCPDFTRGRWESTKPKFAVV